MLADPTPLCLELLDAVSADDLVQVETLLRRLRAHGERGGLRPGRPGVTALRRAAHRLLEAAWWPEDLRADLARVWRYAEGWAASSSR